MTSEGGGSVKFSDEVTLEGGGGVPVPWGGGGFKMTLDRDFFRQQTAFDAFCRWAMTRPSARLQPWRRHRPGRVPHATPHAAGEGVQARANARASNRALRPWRSPTLPVLPIDTGAAALHFPPDRPFPWPIGAHCRSLVAQLITIGAARSGSRPARRARALIEHGRPAWEDRSQWSLSRASTAPQTSGARPSANRSRLRPTHRWSRMSPVLRR